MRRVDVQPVVDKTGGCIPSWKANKLLSMDSEETLVKNVLSSQLIYHLMIFPMQKWFLKQIDRLRRSFNKNGEEPNKVSGEYYLVNWPTICTPEELGGFGILDLERFARALLLHRLWFRW